jgi:DNA-binding MarR family transcriptional regulator
MATKKLTKKDYFNKLLALDEVQADETLVAFIDHELENLAKKSSYKSDKPTAKQKANASVKEAILAEMEKGKLYRISDMQKELACAAELSNQRVSALVRQLVEEGAVVRSEDKRVAYFALAD